ncbi:hypothetical protein GR160_08540 [Flavobacterium sp. Sd200]|uniref:hypothetical protein n=1 Tax=Flavobacterium sp. Sd200 TaxID=2692211 RepID=UPI001367DEA8|nr:hypothetical protein [Flavobacterium sp. Sd200]MXN91275.1 hypothetical protein [Flavobacterium sp. Sd200]
MRNKQLLTKEIAMLNAIKSAYNHYLASGRSVFEVENATQVHYNLYVINRTLRELYRPHPQPLSKGEGSSYTQVGIEHRTSDIRQPKTINQKPTTKNQLTNHFKQLEMKAIMLFNADRRFTITE